jgi:Fic family protein
MRYSEGMIHRLPRLLAADRRLLDRLDALHERLRSEAGTAQPWSMELRRAAEIDSVAGSVSIEGYVVDAGQARALVGGASARGDDAQLAFAGYARAMQHVAVLSADPEFEWSKRLVLDLHFDACSFQRAASPGTWRAGPIYITDAAGGIAYEAPPAHEVPELMGEVVEWLEHGDLDAHVAVRAALAHLQVVSVHPFRDGNGRVSRLVQSLVLARAGILAPSLGSIEPYLARNTPAYYEQLQRAHGAAYDPSLDAAGWIRFCIQAHVHEAERRIDLHAAAAGRWHVLERYVADRGWPDRLVIALEQALVGGLDRARYLGECDISAPTASLDFRQLLAAGLIEATGKGRMTAYHATDALRSMMSPAAGRRFTTR